MKQNYYFLYYFFDNIFVRFARVFIFFAVGFLVFINIGDLKFVEHILPFYFLLMLQEFFIHFKLENSTPSKKISDKFDEISGCMDFRTRAIIERNHKTKSIIKEILREHEVGYFNKLLDYTCNSDDIQFSNDLLLKKTEEILAKINGSYIHGLDVYAAYLLLIDKESKTLFQNDITENDLLTVLSWVRKKYSLDNKKHHALIFSGSGVFDFFIYGWSGELSRYAVNFTQEVLSQRNSVPIGRDREYDLLITALSKDTSSNALLIGPAGIGKTALISQFVTDSNEGLLPNIVSNKIVFKLYPERLIAGINNEGDLEERFVYLFSELLHAGNIIVYIPNIEGIFGGGGLNIDISGALVEYLRSNRIKIIGTTTQEAFQKYIYPKQEIKELFDTIQIDEPDHQASLFMVLEKSGELSYFNRVFIKYSAIKEACLLSESYSNDGSAMPGRAIRLLEDSISNARTHGIKNVTKKEVREFVEEKTHIALDKPDREESEKLLNLENEIHKRIVSQDEAIKAIANAMRRVRSGMKSVNRPIASFLFLGPTGVGKTQTAKALAKSYFGDEKTMIRLDMSEYQTPESVERMLGKSSGDYEETIVDKILNNPFSLVLLDEFEKAYPRILDLFLQILDEGRLTDNIGRTVSFSNTIIIATSNAGSEFIREEYEKGMVEDVKRQLTEKVLQANIFKPELINRFDEVIIFKPLDEKDVIEVSKLFLKEIIDRVSEQQITLSYDESVPKFIAKSAFNIEFGARNIRRFIEQSVENQLSNLILSNQLASNGNAKITIENNAIAIKI